MSEEIFKKISNELVILGKTLLKEEKESPVKLQHLQQRLAFVKWANEKLKIKTKNTPKYVYQKEIFFCNFGDNIGHELNGKRPVVIMQNDIGNMHSTTTIVIPITSYQHSTFFNIGDKQYIKCKDDSGKEIIRELNFYEIPIEVEDGSLSGIYGVANVTHIRELSKKRLSSVPIAKVTENTYNKIVNATIKNISKI